MPIKYLGVVRTVHWLQCVFFTFASSDAEEFVSKLIPVTRSHVQVFFGDVWNRDTLVAVLVA